MHARAHATHTHARTHTLMSGLSKGASARRASSPCESLCAGGEGVEDQEALTAVTRMGCDRVQGFYLAKPMPVSQFRDWVLRRAS